MLAMVFLLLVLVVIAFLGLSQVNALNHNMRINVHFLCMILQANQVPDNKILAYLEEAEKEDGMSFRDRFLSLRKKTSGFGSETESG